MQADGKPLTTTSKSFRMYRMKQSTPRYRLEGKTFHLLTVVRYVGPSLWECLCQCGRLKNVRTQNLLNGRTKSCGCWRLEVSKSRAAHWDTFVSPDITTKYPRTSMLSYLELVELVHNKVITGVKPERINAASIDVTLGPVIFVERPQANAKVVDLSAHPRQYPEFDEVTMGDGGFVLHPGCFLLASTVEVFNLPNYIQADYFLNSSLARAGLTHALAGFCDPGWHGSNLTLELKNWTEWTSLRIRPGMKIGQVEFNRVTPVPEHRSYSTIGSYNNSQGVTVR